MNDQFYIPIEAVVIFGIALWTWFHEWRWSCRIAAIQSDLDKLHMGQTWGKPYDWSREDDDWDRAKEHQRAEQEYVNWPYDQ